MNKYNDWSTCQLVAHIEHLERERTHILAWIICEAWTLLEPRDDDHAQNWRGYTEQHAKDALETWGK